MQTWEEKILIKQEGIAEGRLEEKKELTRKLANKFSIEQIAEMLEIDISEVEKIIKEIAIFLTNFRCGRKKYYLELLYIFRNFIENAYK